MLALQFGHEDSIPAIPAEMLRERCECSSSIDSWQLLFPLQFEQFQNENRIPIPVAGLLWER